MTKKTSRTKLADAANLPATESVADRLRRFDHEAAKRAREAKAKQAWKNEGYQWVRQVEVNSHMRLYIRHPLGDESYQTHDIDVSFWLDGVNFGLTLPHKDMRRLGQLLIEACLHDKRMQKKASQERMYDGL